MPHCDVESIAKILMSVATFSLDCLDEDVPIRGNLIDSGDSEADAADEQAIVDQLNSGNRWAWCTARVSASYAGFEATDYLGCCSYGSEAAFRADGYADMCLEACRQLAEKLIAANEAFQLLTSQL
jgi:hypothetical protein